MRDEKGRERAGVWVAAVMVTGIGLAALALFFDRLQDLFGRLYGFLD